MMQPIIEREPHAIWYRTRSIYAVPRACRSWCWQQGRDGGGRQHALALPGLDRAEIYTPDDITAGRVPESPVVVFDDDHYYMGGVVAEMLRVAWLTVTLITPESLVSSFTQFTLEQAAIQRRPTQPRPSAKAGSTRCQSCSNGWPSGAPASGKHLTR
jgi:hypothetical protein